MNKPLDDPKFSILFPTQMMASSFAEAMRFFGIVHMGVDQSGPVVVITGVDHPELQHDILHAAKLVGGDQIPNRKEFQ